jgi:hypothetical protein
MITVLRSQVFSVKGKDAFEIALCLDDSINTLSITGSLPEVILNKIQFNFEEFIGINFENQARIFTAMRIYSEQLLSIPGIERYFFEDYLLNERGELNNEEYARSRTELFCFAEFKPKFISAEMHYWPCFYLKTLYLQANDGYLPHLECELISRTQFESYINNREYQSLYVDLYSTLTFVQVRSSCEEPSFVAALSNGSVKMAFLNYSSPVFPAAAIELIPDCDL